MGDFKNQHYIQEYILKKYSTSTTNNKFVNLINIKDNTLEYKRTDKAMTEDYLYNFTDSEEPELEKKLNIFLETDIHNVLDRILKTKEDEVIITRRELIYIKKYLLIQLYRNKYNRVGYVDPPKGAFEYSSLNIEEGELKEDFWRREMIYILENDWDHLLIQKDFIGVQKHALEINGGFLMFFRPSDEFIINDIGIAIEELPVIPTIKETKDMVEFTNEYYKKQYGIEGAGYRLIREILEGKSKIQNFRMLPFSPELAIANVNGLWKPEHDDRYEYRASNILLKYLSFPENIYKNQDLMTKEKQLLLRKGRNNYLRNMHNIIPKFKSLDDKYIYKVHKLDDESTSMINQYMLNEAYEYVCYRDPVVVTNNIMEYNIKKYMKIPNVKKDYNKITRQLIVKHNL